MSTNMLKELKFVQGSVGKKDLVPAMTHFRIEGGSVRGYNGTIAICTPIPFDIDCIPKAEPLIKAIQNCEETIMLSLTPTGRLAIKSGSFKAFIECVQGETPHVLPEGEVFEVNGQELLAAFKVLAPFVGDDASRPFTNGILLDGMSAFATNNAIVVEYWIGVNFPHRVNVPRQALKEILRVNEPPVSIQCSENSITFHYSEGRWIRSQLIQNQWPDLKPILNRKVDMRPINPAIFVGLAKIKPFTDKLGRVYFTGEGLKTHLEEGEGSTYDIDAFGLEGIYNIEMLQLLEPVVKSICWESYPDAAMFHGERIRGAIIGMKF